MPRTSCLMALTLAVSLLPGNLMAQTGPTAKSMTHPHTGVQFTVFDRTRVDAWQWFAAPHTTETYGYLESLLRLGARQQTLHWAWQAELTQAAILDAPTTAVAPVLAQGQLGLGATYYASNGNNAYPAAAFFKQGWLGYAAKNNHWRARLGRFEFFEGQEMKQTDTELAWLQTHRIAQRLIGNFGFSNAQRSVDGVEAHADGPNWDVTAAGARVDQGVFNMNGNPELNVDFLYAALTRRQAHGHLLWRAFAVGYHDGRTGILKTDNRPLPVRTADHRNIRIGTYGGDALAVIPTHAGTVDMTFWGALQNGSWGADSHSANAVAAEAGYHIGTRLHRDAKLPWFRGGWWRASGDSNPGDSTHGTFFQVLPTPRVYARLPFYNLMNSTDSFVQIMDKPTRTLALRSDLHWLRLTSSQDLWYLGGGAFDNKVFGFVGRPANGNSSFASVADLSADWQVRPSLALNAYYAYAQGKSAIGSIYPTNKNMQYGYAELVYSWGRTMR